MLMKKHIALVLVASIGMCPFSANAGANWCSFTVDHVWTNAGGGVFALLKERGDHLQFCSLTSAYQGVAMQTCKSWNQLLLVAALTKKKVTIHYDNIPSCETIPSYGAAPVPTYIMLNNP